MNGTQVAGRGGPAAGIEIRPARPSDCEPIRDFLAGLSLRTRYLRFFAGVAPATPAMLRRLTGEAAPPAAPAASGAPAAPAAPGAPAAPAAPGAPGAPGAGLPGAGGGEHIDALLATEDGVIIGHAMATDTREPSGARAIEIGVVVADARQRRGVGSALTRALASRAQARGATVILMDVLAENRDILSMITNHFPAADHRRSGPYVSIHIPLPRDQEEQPRESLSGAPEPERPRPGRQRRRPRRAAADLPVG
ncbi:MAG TPA: GNAT family N-acetyltransferase [Streptosporangiaceae bacterium]